MTETKGNKERNLNLYEGEAPLRDYNGSKDGKPVFETTNLDEWDKHCREKGLTVSGTDRCVFYDKCKNVVAFENLPYGEKPLCESCLENVNKYSKHVTIKKLPKPDNHMGDTEQK